MSGVDNIPMQEVYENALEGDTYIDKDILK